MNFPQAGQRYAIVVSFEFSTIFQLPSSLFLSGAVIVTRSAGLCRGLLFGGGKLVILRGAIAVPHGADVKKLRQVAVGVPVDVQAQFFGLREVDILENDAVIAVYQLAVGQGEAGSVAVASVVLQDKDQRGCRCRPCIL